MRLTASSTIPGTRGPCADAIAVHHYESGDVIACAVVDAIGNDEAACSYAPLAAQVAVRVGARKGALAGLLAAAELIANPTVRRVRPNAVAVLAITVPDCPVEVGWIGDCRA